MYISRATILSLLSAPLLALAQNPNPFSIPSSGLSATGGQPLDLKWTPTTQGTISLILRSGSSDDLAEGTIIASKISNSGAYTWTPSNSLTAGSDYTIEIVSDSNPDETNYTPYFVLDTPTTKAQSTSKVTLGAPSSSVQVSTASPTGKDSTVVQTASSSGASSTTSSKFIVPVHNTFTDRATRTTASSVSGSPTGGASGASATGASASSTGAAAKATAMAAGMLGVALGALAL